MNIRAEPSQQHLKEDIDHVANGSQEDLGCSRDDILTMQGTVNERRKERQKKRWEDNIKQWRGMGLGDIRRRCIVALPSVVTRRPSRLRD